MKGTERIMSTEIMAPRRNKRSNGYSNKTVKSTYGEIDVNVPRDREGSFEPQAIPKRSRDISGIEDKVLSMYAKRMSQRDIADTIEDIAAVISVRALELAKIGGMIWAGYLL